eukprot:403364531
MGNCTGAQKSDAHNEQNNRLLVKTSTWVRDSHELFDYESPHLMKKTFKIHHLLSGIQRNDNEISVVSEDHHQNSHSRKSSNNWAVNKSFIDNEESGNSKMNQQKSHKLTEELRMLSRLEHQPITFVNQHQGIYTIFDLPHQYNASSQRSVILKKKELLKIQTQLQQLRNNGAPGASLSQSQILELGLENSSSLNNQQINQNNISCDKNNSSKQIPQSKVRDYNQNNEKKIAEENKEVLSELNQDQNRLWLIVRYLTVDNKTNQFQLTGGETIKLGRVKFHIREIHVGADDDNQTNYCDNSFEANLQDDSAGDYDSQRIVGDQQQLQQQDGNRLSNISGHEQMMPDTNINRVVRLRSSHQGSSQLELNRANQASHERQISQDILPRARRQLQAVNNQIISNARDSIEDYQSLEDRIMIQNSQSIRNDSFNRHDLEEQKMQSVHHQSVERLDLNRNGLVHSEMNTHNNNNRLASRSQHYDLRRNPRQFEDTLICLSQEEQRIRDSLMGFDPNQEFHGSQGIDPITELYDHTQVNNLGNQNQANFIRDDFDIQDELEDHIQDDNLLEQSFTSQKDQEELHKTMYSNKQPSENQNLCRICFSELFTDQNPLISPCKCSGSMKFIHLECLRTWLSRKENVKTSNNVISYSWRAFHCELCKSEYNDKVVVEGKQYWLFEIQKPKTNYVVLESMQLANIQGNQQQSQNNQSKTLHILNLNQKNQIKIGRGHDNDLRVADISVSRCHAFIKRDPKGMIYLEDNQSKFGTLVMIKAPLVLVQDLTYYIQAGRTIMKLHIQPEWSLLGGIMKSNLLHSHSHNKKQLSNEKISTSQLSQLPIKRKLSNSNDLFYQSINKFCNSETQSLIKQFVSDFKKLREHQIIMDENLVGSLTPSPRNMLQSQDQSFSENIPEEKDDSPPYILQLHESQHQSLIQGAAHILPQDNSTKAQDLNEKCKINMLSQSSQTKNNIINGKIQEIKTNNFKIKLTSLQDQFSNQKIKSHQTVKSEEDEMECEQWLKQRGSLFLSQRRLPEINQSSLQNLTSQKSEERLMINFRSLNQSKEDFFKDQKQTRKVNNFQTPPNFSNRAQTFNNQKQQQKPTIVDNSKTSALKKQQQKQQNLNLQEEQKLQIILDNVSSPQNKNLNMPRQQFQQQIKANSKIQGFQKQKSNLQANQNPPQVINPKLSESKQSVDQLSIGEEKNNMNQMSKNLQNQHNLNQLQINKSPQGGMTLSEEEQKYFKQEGVYISNDPIQYNPPNLPHSTINFIIGGNEGKKFAFKCCPKQSSKDDKKLNLRDSKQDNNNSKLNEKLSLIKDVI